MTEEHARAIFLLAGIEVKALHRLENLYWPDNEHYADVRRRHPWWLAETPIGSIRIGWRKRVISINWGSSPLRCIVTEDDVTKDETMVHAWSYDKAVRYLSDLEHKSAIAASEKQAVATAAGEGKAG